MQNKKTVILMALLCRYPIQTDFNSDESRSKNVFYLMSLLVTI